MMKKMLWIANIAFPVLAFTQVGINTVNPQGFFHVDGSKDNPITGTPTVAQQANDFSIIPSTELGVGTITVGIGTIFPTERLDVANGEVRIRELNTNIGGSLDRLVVSIRYKKTTVECSSIVVFAFQACIIRKKYLL